MIGISIKSSIGLGDGLQFSSVPENYFKETGKKLYDVSKPWFFDHNPHVVRELTEPLEKTVEMWNFSPHQWDWPRPRLEGVYLSNAEIWSLVLGVKNTRLNRPRLYRFEDVKFKDREMILLQTQGKSHGAMPNHVVDHILEKYKPTKRLFHIGAKDPRDLGIPRIETPSFWDLASVISKSQMFIGLDSGPSWVAACYPDVICKKLRMKPTPEVFRKWVPLAIDNIHSHWDDRCQQIFNPSENDVGFTSSYRRM